MYDLSGKTILIIGASSGIGKETARVLVELGASVTLVARREAQLKEVCESLGSDRVNYYVSDISMIDSIESLFDQIVADNGKLDGMVYAAGISKDIPLKLLNYKKMLETFNVNYFGFVECVRQISKKKNYNVGMRIVAISSVASVRGDKAHMSYAASKAAIDASIRCLAVELWEKGIVLNSVQPGMIHTFMYDDYIASYGEDSNTNKKLLERQYMGIGKPEDVANTIAFLLSDNSRFITGVSIPVDGGTLSH